MELEYEIDRLNAMTSIKHGKEDIRKLYNEIESKSSSSHRKYSAQWKDKWSQIYTIANQCAKFYQKYLNRPLIDASDILDSVLCDMKLTTDHCNPADDQVANDMSCMQSLNKQKLEFMEDILAEIVKATDPKVIERLWALYDEEVRTVLRSVDYELYSEFGDATEFFEHKNVSDHDRAVMYDEYRNDLKLVTGIDPDDNRIVGTPPQADEFGFVSYDKKLKADCFDRKRGAYGVLNGLYQNSYPEPEWTANRTAYYRTCKIRNTRDKSIDVEIRNEFRGCFGAKPLPEFKADKPRDSKEYEGVFISTAQ